MQQLRRQLTREKRLAELLMAYVDRPGEELSAADLTEEERAELLALHRLSDRLCRSMPAVRPSAAFVRDLGQELREQARRQVALAKRVRRGLWIGAAAVGSVLSIVSVVGAILFIAARWRARTRALQAPAA